MCPCVLGPQRAGDLRTVVAVAFRSLLRMCSGSSGAYNLTVRSSRRRFMASCYLSASGCCRFGCTSLRRGLTQVLGRTRRILRDQRNARAQPSLRDGCRWFLGRLARRWNQLQHPRLLCLGAGRLHFLTRAFRSPQEGFGRLADRNRSRSINHHPASNWVRRHDDWPCTLGRRLVRPNNSFKPSPLRGLGPTGTASGGPA